MQSYSNAAARTDASLIKYPPATAHQVKSAHHSVQQIEASKPSELDPDTSKKRKRSESTTGVSESSQNKQHQEHSSTAAATHTALVDDDIDWTATTAVPDMQLASPPDSIQGDERQLGADEPDTDLAHSQQAAAVHASECLQQQQAAMAEHGVSSSGGDTGDKHVQHAVGEYVKALLDPFYKAGIIDREVGLLYFSTYASSSVHVHMHSVLSFWLVAAFLPSTPCAYTLHLASMCLPTAKWAGLCRCLSRYMASAGPVS